MPENRGSWLFPLGRSFLYLRVCLSLRPLQGLGTSTDREFKEYFSDLGKHKIDFVWSGEETATVVVIVEGLLWCQPSSLFPRPCLLF